MLSRRICSFGLILMLAALPGSARAWSDAPEPLVRVVADGYLLGFDEGPMVVDDRVVVSWKNLALFYGFALDYDAEEQRITTIRADRSLVVTVGSTEAAVNGQVVTLGVTPYVKEGRVLIPIRSAAEGLGLSVSWDEATRTVHVFGGMQPPPPSPRLTAAEIRSVQFSLSTSLDSFYASQVVTPETPEGLALVEGVATAWESAVPGMYVTEGFMLAGLTPPSIRLELEDGFASASLAPALRGGTGGWNTQGFVRLSITRSSIGESAWVFAPGLAALIDRNLGHLQVPGWAGAWARDW